MLTVQTPSTSFTLPTEWSEVTLRQFVSLHNKLTDVSVRTILKVLASDEQALLHSYAAIDEPTMERLSFLATVPDFVNLPVPDQLAGVKPPTDLGTCTLLQKWSLQDQIEDMQDEEQVVNFITIAVPILAIYLYPLLTKKPLTDAGEIEEVIPLIESLPVIEALPVANFFLSNYRSSISSGRVSFSISQPNHPPRPWLIRWFLNWKPLNRMLFFRRWQKSVS